MSGTVSPSTTQLAQALITPDGLTVTGPGTRIIDQWFNVFDLVPASDPTKAPYQVRVNGTVDPVTGRVTRLVSARAWCCQQNADGGWWYANASRAWVATADPTKHAASPDGTVVSTTTSYLWDAKGVRFSITPAGRVAINDVADAITANVVRLQLAAGVCQQVNAAGSTYAYGGAPGAWTYVQPPPAPTPAPTPPPAGKYYAVSGGAIWTPGGAKFRARGVNMSLLNWPDNSNVVCSEALSDLANCRPLLDRFPGLDFVRFPCAMSMVQVNYAGLSVLKPFVDAMTAKGIVVEIEHHSYPGVLSGGNLTTVCNWYAGVAAAFKDNPNVWFGTQNEPSFNDPAIPGMMSGIYNAIRNAGNGTVILLCPSGGVQNNSLGVPASVVTGMKNVAWDQHFYNWTQGYSADRTVIQNQLNATVALGQQYASQDGPLPTIIGEFGVATDGTHTDPGGVTLCDVVRRAPNTSGYAQWFINWTTSYAQGDLLVTGPCTGLTSDGQALAQAIAAGY